MPANELPREAPGAQAHDPAAVLRFDAVRQAPFAHAVEVAALELGIVGRSDLQEKEVVVGVVDAGPLRITQRRSVPTVFHPTYLRYLPRMTLIAGTADANAEVIDEVERRLTAVDDGAPVRPVMTLEEYLSRTSLGPERVATALVAVSAGVALALAIVGVYAVMADSVREKRREIAVRLALGAPARSVEEVSGAA